MLDIEFLGRPWDDHDKGDSDVHGAWWILRNCMGRQLWFFQTIFTPYELAEEKVDGRKDVVNLVEISSQVRKVNQ